MGIMSNLQDLSSSTSFRELLRKFREKEKWLASTEDHSSPSFWWENSSDEEEDSYKDTSAPFISSPWGECDTKKSCTASSTTHWLAYEDQDTVSLSSSSDEDSYGAFSTTSTASSASSVCSDEDEKHFPEEDDETYFPALGWWKVYRSGWWEHSEGALTHFDETYVEYRFSALLQTIPENRLEEANLP